MLVVCGPSGVGKTTLLDSLLAADPDLHFSVSWTTREPRQSEVDGVDYHFVSRMEFAAEAESERGMIEWATVHNNDYGTPCSEVLPHLRAGHDVLLDVDVQGAAQIRAGSLPAVFVFILPPSTDELDRRLRQRESETPLSLSRRLAQAQNEMRQWPLFDFVMVNDQLATAAEQLWHIRQAARHLVRARRRPVGWQGPLPEEWPRHD